MTAPYKINSATTVGSCPKQQSSGRRGSVLF